MIQSPTAQLANAFVVGLFYFGESQMENRMSEIQISNPKRTALYLRVSTSDQVGGLQTQERTLREFCEKNQIRNFDIFADEGVSGAKKSRPALDQMMAQVREGKIDKVIVYSFSRFARSVTHLLTALEEFRKLNVGFQSYTEAVDTNSPMGRAFFTVIAAISQLERELIVERVCAGLKNARAKGKHIGRKKTRPSEMIRALYKKGLSYRTISSITGASHGSVGLEIKDLRREEALAQKKAETEARAVAEGQLQVLDEAMPWA